ncbi:MAG: hypothetical protein KDK48_05470, partial [Chlamydiia bacterium]|nr:hypothetical protein [Chlamydiia bacterium]
NVGGTPESRFWLLIEFGETSKILDQDVRAMEFPVGTKLFLRTPTISDAGVQQLTGSERIRYLNLDGTAITDSSLEAIGTISSLEGLSLCRTAASDEGIAQLNRLQHLDILRLDDCHISDKGLEAIKAMKSIRNLGLANTLISDFGVQVLDHFPELEYLSLAGTNVTDASIKHLGRCRHLIQLELARTTISNAGIKKLQLILPMCDIRTTPEQVEY